MEALKKHLIMACLAGLVAGCFAPPPGALGPTPEGGHADDGESVEIRVTNLNYNDARLWLVVRRGMKHPLGTVTGKDSGTFTVPWHFSAPVAIEIDLVGGGNCVSDPLTLDPGDWLDFQIPVAFQSGSRCMW